MLINATYPDWRDLAVHFFCHNLNLYFWCINQMQENIVFLGKNRTNKGSMLAQVNKTCAIQERVNQYCYIKGHIRGSD